MGLKQRYCLPNLVRMGRDNVSQNHRMRMRQIKTRITWIFPKGSAKDDLENITFVLTNLGGRLNASTL
jgi:hypothetical protein